MAFSTTFTRVVVLTALWKNCHASMFDLNTRVITPTKASVVDCEVRTIVFNEGGNQHSTQTRCISYADEGDAASREMGYDLPQWLVDKYNSESDRQPSNNFLHIVGGHFSRGQPPTRQQLRYRTHSNERDRVIVDSNAVVLMSDSPFTSNNDDNRRRAAESIGVSSVLVVRVTTNDGSVDLDAATISDRIFGSFGSPASQLKACSMGGKQLVPASGPSIVNGVLELSVNDNIADVVATDFENTINDALGPKVDELSSYDHIVYCLPKGSKSNTGSTSWKAYAYANWNRAVFNNEDCGYLSSLIHEIGHNMGLGHASKGYLEYGDQSGIMGYGYNEVQKPLMCFNGAMNHQLGWYSDKTVDLSDRASCGPWKGRLYGYTDYNSSISNAGVVLIKVNDIFVQFNKISDMNIGSKEKRDVIAFTKGSGAVASTTKSLGEKTSGTWQSGDDVVEICGSHSENGLEYFDIVVRDVSQESICEHGYSLRECVGTDSPSIAPTSFPTPFPTQILTAPPTAPPTLRTALDTTIGPQPTSQPTASPTAGAAPSASPSMLPSEVTSDSPTATPSIPPTVTMSPSNSPTVDTVCDDHEEEVFIFTDEFQVEHEKRCDWLRARPQIQAQLCVPGHNAYDICEESCGKCSDNCEDTDQTFPHHGVDRPCSWLALRWTLAHELCSQPGNPAISVCPETCGACEHLVDAANTTQVP